MVENNHKPNFYDLYQKVGSIESDVKTSIRLLEGHDKRINDVEKTQDQMTGKIAVISAIFGFIGGIIISILRIKL